MFFWGSLGTDFILFPLFIKIINVYEYLIQKSHINLKYSPVYSIFTFINNNLLISEIKLH
jgi:hypothetical protein